MVHYTYFTWLQGQHTRIFCPEVTFLVQKVKCIIDIENIYYINLCITCFLVSHMGILVVYVWKMKYFLKINRSEKIKIITKYFWCLSYQTSITNALLQPIKLSRFLQGNTNTGMVTTHSSFMNGHIWRPFSMKLFVNLSPS